MFNAYINYYFKKKNIKRELYYFEKFFSLLMNKKCMVRNPNQNIYSFVSIVIWRTLKKIHKCFREFAILRYFSGNPSYEIN